MENFTFSPWNSMAYKNLDLYSARSPSYSPLTCRHTRII